MTVTKRVVPRKVAKRLERKVPFPARPGAVVNPEFHPVEPKVPGTRDTGFPASQKGRTTMRPVRVK